MEQDSDNQKTRRILDRYREEIDGIDSQIISLLSRRQEIAVSVGTIKRGLGIEVLDQAREEDVLKRVISARGKNMPENTVRQIFTEIISAARSVQQALVVSFLGPEGTFCHQVALNIFGHSTTLRSADTIAGVFDLVEKGVCRQGVVPVENSSEGSVNDTLDLLYKYDLKITGEAFLRIRHHLLGMTDDLEDIERFYSHPMAISQCRSWIRENLPGVPIGEMESTSAAARRAAEEPGAGAIGNRISARTYNLYIVKENIEDNPNNEQ